jgi:hypothetical protein
VGEEVMLSTKNISLRRVGDATTTPKLMPKWVGPFKVVQTIGKAAYKLELPPTLKIHNVFHVSLLKPYRSDGSIQPPQPLICEGEEWFVVEAILDHKERKYGQGVRREYLIKWANYGREHNSWEPESSVCELELFPLYWEARGLEPPGGVALTRDSADDTLCSVCGSPSTTPPMLLCDGCDAGYHISCLKPPLSAVPRGKWLCPVCSL